jgi:phosphohistidine phosphatase SixA
VQNSIVFTENLLPLAHPDHMWEELKQYSRVDSLALVGHEPNMSALANLLLGETRLQIVFKKGGVCHMTVDDLSGAPAAVLQWLLTPKQMVAIGQKR